MTSSSRSDWSNYWQGRQASESGEVFGGVGIEQSQDLADFWQDSFKDDNAHTILDLACGAESVLKHLKKIDGKSLLGVDISADALRIAEQSINGFRGIVASIDALPFEDNSADLIVSQFGFEYAGVAAADEIHRVLKPNGRFIAIAHMTGGAIEAECQGHLDRLDIIKNSGFIPRTTTLVTEMLAFDRSGAAQYTPQLQNTIQAFQRAQNKLLPLIKDHKLAGHLFSGARQLFENRQNYEPEAIYGWLTGMSGEIDAYHGRMNSMLGAALTDGDIAKILRTVAGADGSTQKRVFTIGADRVAHILNATKSV